MTNNKLKRASQQSESAAICISFLHLTQDVLKMELSFKYGIWSYKDILKVVFCNPDLVSTIELCS